MVHQRDGSTLYRFYFYTLMNFYYLLPGLSSNFAFVILIFSLLLDSIFSQPQMLFLTPLYFYPLDSIFNKNMPFDSGNIYPALGVHTILKDVYHPSVYFRFQPNLTEDIAIDESKPAKLDLLCEDAERFIVEHGGKLEETAASLMAKKRPHQRVHTWLTSNWDKLSSLAHYSNIKHWVKS